MGFSGRPKMARAWSDLPPEALSSIGKRLESGLDIIQFRSVCRKWRSFRTPSLLNPVLPCTLSNLSLPFSDEQKEPLLLVARTVFLVYPLFYTDHPKPSGWILTAEEAKQGKLRILYPLSNDHVKHLPSNFPKCLDLSKFDAYELINDYGLKFASDGKDVPGVHKVVVCSDCTAMVLYGKGSLVGVRLDTGKWGFVRRSLVCAFLDMIKIRGMIYALDRGGDVNVVDHKTMKVIKTIVVDPLRAPEKHRKLLAEWDGALWLVVWHRGSSSTDRVQFVVYTLDEVQHKWIEVQSLYPRVPFVSLNSCFIVHAEDLNIWEYTPTPRKASWSIHNDDEEVYDDEDLSWHPHKWAYLVYSVRCLDSFAYHYLSDDELFERASVNLDICLFFFRSHDRSSMSKPLCSSITGVLWPPPTWFWSDAFSSSG